MEKKLDNKGFSLVELIIVIAIMAILVGVLAPQYIKYVEKSRTSTDIQTLSTIHDALITVSTDPAYTLTADVTLTLNQNSALTGLDGLPADVKTALTDIIGDPATIKGKSKAGNGVQVVYVQADDKVVYKVNGTVTNDISTLGASAGGNNNNGGQPAGTTAVTP